eukprot:scaffold59637_cov50-Phaeocystis_antarctica.AAC.5
MSGPNISLRARRRGGEHGARARASERWQASGGERGTCRHSRRCESRAMTATPWCSGCGNDSSCVWLPACEPKSCAARARHKHKPRVHARRKL